MSTPLTDRINALTAYSNNKTGASDTTLSDAVTRLVNGYGGGSIEDGIVVTERNANGFAISAELYGSDIVPEGMFCCGNANNILTTPTFQFRYLTDLKIHYAPTSIEQFAFAWCQDLANIDADFSKVETIKRQSFCGISAFAKNVSFPKLVSMTGDPFKYSGITSFSADIFNDMLPNNCFSNCTNLRTVNLPRVKKIGQYTSLAFYNDTALTDVVFGSVGYRVESSGDRAFENCTQTGLNITTYTTGDKVDSLLTKFRTGNPNGATNATIIFKASEATTYNSTSYAAGDTILTSTPNS